MGTHGNPLIFRGYNNHVPYGSKIAIFHHVSWFWGPRVVCLFFFRVWRCKIAPSKKGEKQWLRIWTPKKNMLQNMWIPPMGFKYRVTKFKLIQRIFWNLVYAFHWVPFEFWTFGNITKHASPQSFAGLRHIFLNNSMLKIEQLDN